MKRKFYNIIIFFALFFGMNPAETYAGWVPLGGGAGTNPGTAPANNEGGTPQNPPNNTSCAGDPVFLQSGQFIYSCQDLYIPGRAIDIDIQHIYRSNKNFNGHYGYGWTINYYERLQTTSTGSVIFLHDDDRKDEWMFNGTSYVPPAGFFETLTHNTNGTWTKTDAHGMKKNYDTLGLLTSIVDRNNNQITLSYDPAGLLPINGVSLFTQVPGQQVMIGQDYRLSQITGDNGTVVNFNYNADGRLTSIVDQSTGRTVSFAYDPNTNDLLSITKPSIAQYPSGIVKSFTYTNHNLITITDPKNQVFVTNHYNPAGKVDTQTLGTGTMTFSYATNQATVTDRKGFVTIYNFTAQGNVSSMQEFTQGLRPSDPASYTTTYTYNADGMKTSVTYPRGNGIKYVYDDTNADYKKRGNLLTIRRKTNMAASDNNTNDIVTTVTYDVQYNFPKVVTDPKGFVTTYTYDYELPTTDPYYGTAGNLVRIDYPAVSPSTGVPAVIPQVKVHTNSFGRPTEIIDPNNNVTQYTYYATTGYLENIIQDPNPSGQSNHINAITHYTYDNFGNVASITDAENHTTNYVWNELHWLINETNPLGLLTRYEYDQNGNLKKIERQKDINATLWQKYEFTYTVLNDLNTILDPLNRTTSFGYDNNQNRTSMLDANGKQTVYQYDERDLLWKEIDARTPAGVTEYSYNLNGEVSKIKDANANATNYTYDLVDRLQTKMFANGTSTHTYTYDKNSNLTIHQVPSGDTLTYVYDALNRMRSKSYSSNATLNATYDFDAGSRLTNAATAIAQNSFQYDNLNRMKVNVQALAGNAYTVGYDYDKVGNRTQLTYPLGLTFDYSYDARNRFDQIKFGPLIFADYNYDLLDRVKERFVYAGTTHKTFYGFNDANELESIDSELLGFARLNRALTYDGVGNRLSKLETVQVPPGGASLPLSNAAFGYDNVYQLTSMSGTQTQSFQYDLVGNRQQAVVAGQVTNYVANNLNQYTSVASPVGTIVPNYNANGNLTNDGFNTLTYDEENRLQTAQNANHSANYFYDAFGRRVGKLVDGNIVQYVFDGDEAIEERDITGAAQALYLYGKNIDEPLLMYRAGQAYIYDQDDLGSTQIMTDWAGNVAEFHQYDAYGNDPYPSAIGNPIRYTGRWIDSETGLYDYRNRMYSPSLGRFLQRDPLGYVDGMNLFAYVGNNAVNMVDPWGEQALPGEFPGMKPPPTGNVTPPAPTINPPLGGGGGNDINVPAPKVPDPRDTGSGKCGSGQGSGGNNGGDPGLSYNKGDGEKGDKKDGNEEGDKGKDKDKDKPNVVPGSEVIHTDHTHGPYKEHKHWLEIHTDPKTGKSRTVRRTGPI